MLKCQRSLFSITKEYVYLNCAYMSPLLKSSHDAGMEMLIKQSFPQEVAIDDFFTPPEQLRKAFAQLINANSSDRIAIVSSASYGIANAANNIPLEAQDNIIVMDEQFPSHVYVWQKLAAEKKDGKRGFRVYPIWDLAINKQAEKTQKWQLNYFVEYNDKTDLEFVKKLFQQKYSSPTLNL